MTRYMYDATKTNAGVLVAKNPEMVAIYLTGSSDIRWTSTQVQFFPRVKTFVRIDQGGPTSPQFMAHVVDVEPGAWSVTDAENRFLPNCTAPRPTIYCDRNDYQHVTAKCDIWLAAPGLTDAQAFLLRKADPRIVAIQNVFAGDYDRSVVFDDFWPEKPPVVQPSQQSYRIQIERWQSGFGWVLETTPKIVISDNSIITKPGTKYRARFDSGQGWSGWQEIVIP